MVRLSDADLTIKELATWEWDIPLTDSFTISRGSVPVARNLFIKVTLQNGVAGYGESAPFPGLTGENREGTFDAVDRLRGVLIGQSSSEFRGISRELLKLTPRNPAARCGLETAILDAFCRALGIPVWSLFGGAAVHDHETDITIPIVTKDRCLELARQWYQQGFRTFKMKVGKDHDSDLANILALSRRYPDLSFIVDANQVFSESDAVKFINALKKSGVDIRFIEQPVVKEDLPAMAKLRSVSPFPICADESVASRHDVAAVLKDAAADIVNIKIMKSGVIEAYDIAVFALAGGIDIMFGGMVETRLAMSCSLALAAGIGQVHTLDLDTPLMMTYDPWHGGYTYKGPTLSLSPMPGLGVLPDYPTDTGGNK